MVAIFKLAPSSPPQIGPTPPLELVPHKGASNNSLIVVEVTRYLEGMLA